LVFIAIGFELGFSVIAGIVLGQYVDNWLEVETPWFTIIGLVAGMIAGFSLLIRMIKRIDDRKELMTEKTTSLINIPSITVEIISLIVTAILVVVSYLVGSRELAFGVAAGGVLFTANYVAIRFVVNALVSNTSSTSFGIFVFIIKMLILIGIVASLFIFTDVNIYGFFIGVTGVVIVIIGESLRRSTNGSL